MKLTRRDFLKGLTVTIGGALVFRGGDDAQLQPTSARVIYVNGHTGKDFFPGTDPTRPKRTIKAALAACNPGDTAYINGGSYELPDIVRVPKGVNLAAYRASFAYGPGVGGWPGAFDIDPLSSRAFVSYCFLFPSV